MVTSEVETVNSVVRRYLQVLAFHTAFLSSIVPNNTAKDTGLTSGQLSYAKRVTRKMGLTVRYSEGNERLRVDELKKFEGKTVLKRHRIW